MRHLPHLVLDGAVAAAQALGAREAIVVIDGRGAVERAILERAIETRNRRRLDGRVELRLAASPGGFVAGEETAVVNLLNGREAKPTFKPPLPFERGVRGAPTLVQNVETLAHIGLIARHGSDWFRQVGTVEQPGTALLTVSGAVDRPGVYEVAFGTSLVSAALGGGRRARRATGLPLRRVLRRVGPGDARQKARAFGIELATAAGRTRRRSVGRASRVGLRPRRDRACHPLSRERERRPVRPLCARARRDRQRTREPRLAYRRRWRAASDRTLASTGARTRRLPPSRRDRALRRLGARSLLRRACVSPPWALQRPRPAHAPARRALVVSATIRVNPIDCKAHGLCAELLPERITLDDWGYPIVDGEPVSHDLLQHARRAAAACPTLALVITATKGKRQSHGAQRGRS